MEKRYINEEIFYYHLKLSHGKGFCTKELSKIFEALIYNISTKQMFFRNQYISDMKQYAFQKCLENFLNFDFRKYELVLPYFTEVVKRGFAFEYNFQTGTKRIGTGRETVKLRTISLDTTFDTLI